MNFMKYPTKNDISISNAVLKLAKLQNAERLELTAATGRRHCDQRQDDRKGAPQHSTVADWTSCPSL